MRNLLQDEILMRSEEMCRKHISDVGATNSVINADLGLATLLGPRWARLSRATCYSAHSPPQPA